MMNQIATQQERLPMDAVGMSTTGAGSKIAPQTLGEVVKFAEVMCRADIALPKHLRGNAGACMAVAMQAMEWQLSPFAVASKSYAVNGAIAYEAQLIAAVVNTRSGIKGRLRYRYEGEGPNMTCTVSGVLDGEECEYTSPTIGSITTKNSPLWKSDPQQQLGYFAARSWARRHCPEVILGVYDRDEATEFQGPDNARDVTPKQTLSQRLTAGKGQPDEGADAQEGFSRAHVQNEVETALTGEIMDNTDTGSNVSSEPNTDDESPASSVEGDGETPAPSPSSNSEREILIRYAADILPKAADQTVPPAALTAIEKRWLASELVNLSEDNMAKARSISSSMRSIANGKITLEEALDFFAEALECSRSQIGGA